MEASRPVLLKAITPASKKPAWAIDEYASMRLTSRWVMATTEPKTIVIIAMMTIAGRHCHSAFAIAT